MLISKATSSTLFKTIIFLSISMVSHLAIGQKMTAKRNYNLIHNRNTQNPTTAAVGSSHESQLALGQEIYDPAARLSAYPNPVITTVQLSWKGQSIKRIELSDMNGRLVKLHYPKIAQSDQEEFDLSNFESGIYFATAYNLLGGSSTIKIIKK